MSTPDNAVAQAQHELNQAKRNARRLDRRLETLQAELESYYDGQENLRDVQTIQAQIYETKTALEDHRRNVLPALRTAVSKAQSQQVIDQITKDNSTLLNAEQVRNKAAEVAFSTRQQLDAAKQELDDNAHQVTQLIDTLQRDPEVQDNEHISFPAPGQVTIHGVTYTATGAHDLHFMAQRAINQTWAN
jgi:chromosome segregation ATPase